MGVVCDLPSIGVKSCNAEMFDLVSLSAHI